MTHRICNFSGGLCSFFAAKREVDKFGPLNCTLLFADTLVEDPQLYEFNERAAAFLGVPITRISLELTPWQLFRRERMIGNDRFPICSTKLKREILNAWMEGNFEMNRHQDNALFQNAACIVGFDWTESHRVTVMQAAHPTWEIVAPMQEGEIWDKCRMQREAEALGFNTPDLYAAGFPHFNCGGRCVRAGISHWAHLYKTKPERFLEWEQEEQETAEYLLSVGVQPLSMLKKTVNKISKPLYLSELRQRIESGEEMDKHDWGGCGCSAG